MAGCHCSGTGGRGSWVDHAGCARDTSGCDSAGLHRRGLRIAACVWLRKGAGNGFAERLRYSHLQADAFTQAGVDRYGHTFTHLEGDGKRVRNLFVKARRGVRLARNPQG